MGMEINSNDFLFRSYSTHTITFPTFMKFKEDSEDDVREIKRKYQVQRRV